LSITRVIQINDTIEAETMPKISLDMPAQLLSDIKTHVGDDGKFVSVADAIRTACRKLLDQLDEIDARHGRMEAIE